MGIKRKERFPLHFQDSYLSPVVFAASMPASRLAASYKKNGDDSVKNDKPISLHRFFPFEHGNHPVEEDVDVLFQGEMADIFAIEIGLILSLDAPSALKLR